MPHMPHPSSRWWTAASSTSSSTRPRPRRADTSVGASMESATTVASPLRAILWGGLLCGALDITAAFVIYGAMGQPPMRLLQGIASGLLGPRAFSGGMATALLGFFFEFVI